jgi:hypothetical protein
MFRTTASAVEPAPDVIVPAEPVPLSHLELDLVAPPLGWMLELDRCGIQVITDDLGRLAISRDAARALIAEHNANEARAREKRAAAERQAIEADRVRRASIWRGLPAIDLPVGVSASSAMLQAAKDAQPRRESVLQHALGNSGELVFHPSPRTVMRHEPFRNRTGSPADSCAWRGRKGFDDKKPKRASFGACVRLRKIELAHRTSGFGAGAGDGLA